MTRHVGRSWEAPVSGFKAEAITREVTGVHSSGKLIVRVKGSTSITGAELIAPGDLEATIAFDTRALASARKLQAEADARAAQEAERRRLAEDTDGFAELFQAPQRSRVIACLTRQVSVQGLFASRRDHARRLVAEGHSVMDRGRSWGREVTSPNKTFLVERDLTKTMVDYIVWLALRQPAKE